MRNSNSYLLLYGNHRLVGQLGGLLDYAGKLHLENFYIIDFVRGEVVLRCTATGPVEICVTDLDDYETKAIKTYLERSFDSITNEFDVLSIFAK